MCIRDRCNSDFSSTDGASFRHAASSCILTAPRASARLPAFFDLTVFAGRQRAALGRSPSSSTRIARLPHRSGGTMSKNTFRFQYLCLSLLLVNSILGTARLAYSATGHSIANNTPPFVQTASEIGPANPSQTIQITVWLNVHNRQQLDSVAADLYDCLLYTSRCV